MKIRITAAGIFDAAGEEVPVGTRMTVKNEPTAWAGRYEVLSGGEGDEEKTLVTNPAKGKGKGAAQPDATFQAEEREGAWVIIDSNGNVIGKPLTADDAKAFNDLKDADKADFAAEHGKA
jgi:hypothetical protein